jgi:hypothetical protein
LRCQVPVEAERNFIARFRSGRLFRACRIFAQSRSPSPIGTKFSAELGEDGHPGHGLAGFSRLRVLPQLRGVSGGLVSPCSARSTSSGFFSQNACASSRLSNPWNSIRLTCSPNLSDPVSYFHIRRTGGSFSFHCRSFDTLSSNRRCSSRDVPIRILARLIP